MNLLLPLIVIALGVTLLSQVSNFYVSSRKTTRETQMNQFKLEAAREMGSVVRAAYDLYVRNGNACPATPTIRSVPSDNGTILCWSTVNRGCLVVSGMNVCLNRGFVVDNSGLTKQYWARLFVPSVHAQRDPLSGPPPTPRNFGYTNGQVRLRVANNLAGDPKLATTFAPDCNDSLTQCITVSFCVDTVARVGCAGTDYFITQTYALWRNY